MHEALERLDAIFDSIDPPTNSGIYNAQTRGMAPLHLIFAGGDSAAQAAARKRIADYLRGLPRLRELRATDERVALDRLDIPAGAADTRRFLPVRGAEGVALSSGSAIQFAYLVSTALRLSAEAGAPVDEDMRLLYDFLLDDTLRFYWEEAPAWHWVGAYENLRERTEARFGFWLRLGPDHFRAFIDYDLHVFAIAADLRAAMAARPALADRGDLALVNEVLDQGFRALRERLDGGETGDGFGFDRGYWRQGIGFEYTACEGPEPPAEPCGPPAADHPDVSHAQRWPHWLASFRAAARARGDETLAAELDARRRGLARQIAREALTWREGRPVLRNFIDGTDGWYRYDEGGRGYGHPPSSLTGWAFGFGAYALLAPLDERLARAQRTFCRVIESDLEADIDFRMKFYSQNPITPRPADQPAKDDYRQEVPALFACRAYRAMGCF